MDWRLGTRYDPERLANVRLTGKQTSYFSAPRDTRDERLLDNAGLRPEIAQWILDALTAHLDQTGLEGYDEWLEVYVAGSSLTRLWQDRGDLDVLIGVHWAPFYLANPTWKRHSRPQAAERINKGLHDDIWVDDWYGLPGSQWAHPFDVTFYVNSQSPDIRDLRPYAAWDVRHGIWAVHPIDILDDWDPDEAHPLWASVARREIGDAEKLIMKASAGDVLAAKSAAELWDRIHSERTMAFGRLGGGFDDYQTYRWQSHKRAGTAKALRDIKKAVHE